jgi:FkbM family methyltransferase
VDYRETSAERRRSWYGLKKHAKHFLSLRVPHALLRQALRVFPGLRRSGRLPAPAGLREVRGFARTASFVMVKPDGCEIAKELYWGKGRRPKPPDRLALELFAGLAERSDAMLDIGAYTGIFTLAGTGVNARLAAHAFEIVPEVFDVLRENCERNDVSARTTLHLAGVGSPGDTMRVPASTGGSALPSYYSRSTRFDEGVEVEFVSLDSLLEIVPAAAKVVVKIDVEGTEDAVLRHGQEFLAALKPDILCEVLAGTANAGELERLLSPHGYELYLVRDDDLLPLTSLRPDARFRDWLFTTRGAGELAEIGIPIAGDD